MKQLSIFKEEEKKLAPKWLVYYDKHHNYFRCTYCDKMLSCTTSSWIKYCPNCGKKLNWDTHEYDDKGNSRIKNSIKNHAIKDGTASLYNHETN